ncbi:hypothetical protein [Nocardioides houyundeii]|uniref:hypothetical protein n=1 Tax=Nocardioides houyundeii TaxID=2045452 RepID=UPI0013B3ADA6
MDHMTLLMLRLTASLRDRVRDERGDVPGWVLIVVMTAGIVTVIGSLAKTELQEMLRTALTSVKG